MTGLVLKLIGTPLLVYIADLFIPGVRVCKHLTNYFSRCYYRFSWAFNGGFAS